MALLTTIGIRLVDMKNLLRATLALISVGLSSHLLTACAPLGGASNPSSVLAEIDDISTGALQTRPAVVAQGGTLSILHANKEGRVVLQSGAQRRPMDSTARVKVGAGYFQLVPAGEGLQALWWSHQDGKNVYFTARPSADQPFSDVSMVNDDHQILPPFTVANGKNSGAVGVAYQDERLPKYQAFFNRSTDAGRTWPRPDTRLDTPVSDARSSFVGETQLVQTDKVWLAAWVDTIPSSEGPFRIIARRSMNEGLTWEAPQTIFVGQRHISSLKVLAQGHRIAVVADELKRGVFAVLSNDDGLRWQPTTVVQGSDGATNSGIEAVLGAEHLHLVWMQDSEGQKTKVFAASVTTSGGVWASSANRVDLKAHENTRSEVPVIALTTTGTLVAAWVDYRDIRPNIYIAASYDQGQTWGKPTPVRKPGELSLGWPSLIPWEGDVALGFEMYPTDTAREGRFMVQRVKVGSEAKALPALVNVPVMTEEQRRVRLEQRIKALWDARVKGDHATAYDFFDFAYKKSTPKKFYLENTGVITYLAYTPDKMTIKGNEADVNVKIRYEVKPVIIPSTGKPISVTPVDVDSPGTWVWVGDDWYFVYSPAFDPPVLRY